MLGDVLLKPHCFLNEIDMATVTDCCGRGPFSAQQTLTSTVNTMTGSPATFPIGTTMKPFFTSLLCQHLVFKCKQCFGNKLILL